MITNRTATRAPRQQRGQDRREALCAAATRLAAEHGPAACTARAVAVEAALPLAAVSYYFPDLSVLVGEAVRRVCDQWREHARQVADRTAPTTPFEPGSARLATALAAAVLPPGGPGDDGGRAAQAGGADAGLPGPAAVTTRYRHLLAAADSPIVTAEMARLRADLVLVIGRMLPGSDLPAADLLLTVIDGAALGAVTEGDPDPARRVVAAVELALDGLALDRLR